MKKLHFKFTGNVNQLHDELLTIEALRGHTEHQEDIMSPVFGPAPIAPGFQDDPERVRMIQVGEEVRQTVTVETPNLYVESLDDNIWLTVPDDFDESLIDKAILNHVPKKVEPIIPIKDKIEAAQTLEEVKKVLSDYFS